MENTSKKSFIISAVVLILVAGVLVFQYFFNSNNSSAPTPPKITINYPKYKGSISGDVVCQIPGTYTFTEDKVSTESGDIATLQAGIHIYHSDTDITAQKIIDKIDSVSGNKILIAYYPSLNNTEQKFSIYKSLTGQNTLDLSTTIPANEGFTIFSCKETKIHGIKTETEFGSALPTVVATKPDNGWVLMAAPQPDTGKEFKDKMKDAKGKNNKVKSAWAQEGTDFDFGDKEETPESATLKSSYKMVWVEFGAPAQNQLPAGVKVKFTPDSSGIDINTLTEISFGKLTLTSDTDTYINSLDFTMSSTTPGDMSDYKYVYWYFNGNKIVADTGTSTATNGKFLTKYTQNGGLHIPKDGTATLDVKVTLAKSKAGAKYKLEVNKIGIKDNSSFVTPTISVEKSVGKGVTAAKPVVNTSYPTNNSSVAINDLKTKQLKWAGSTQGTYNQYADKQFSAPTLSYIWTIKDVASGSIVWELTQGYTGGVTAEDKDCHKTLYDNNGSAKTGLYWTCSYASIPGNISSKFMVGKTYSLSVTASDGITDSDASTISFSVADVQDQPATPPSAPGNLKFVSSSSTDTTAFVNWDKPTSNGGSAVTKYNLFYGVGACTGTNPTGSTIIDVLYPYNEIKGLTPNTKYGVYVRATNAINNNSNWSDKSNCVEFTTLSTVSAAPSITAGPTFNYTYDKSTYVYWDAKNVDAGKTQFRISYIKGGCLASVTPSNPLLSTVKGISDVSSNSVASGYVSVLGKPYTTDDLIPGTTYGVMISVTNDSKTWSQESSCKEFKTTGTVSAPSAPGKPTVSESTINSAKVSWTAPSNTGSSAISDYLVSYASGGCPADLSYDQTNTYIHTSGLSYIISSLAAGSKYSVWIEASNGPLVNGKASVGWSPDSQCTEFTTKPIEKFILFTGLYQCNAVYSCSGDYTCGNNFSCTTYTCDGAHQGGPGGAYECTGNFVCTSKDLSCTEGLQLKGSNGCYLAPGAAASGTYSCKP
ncbi:MAG: fibronectin type III domain-containing protein [Candidatus Peregrinibacteria bacterium]|nr:fibronectin type III domain-containing protein [Candidatus Peregrinibacteria bacterium]